MTEAPKSSASPVALLLQDPFFKTQIAQALPRHMTPERMARIALTEVRKNPKLLQADKMSFAGAIMACAQLGLEPGNGLGHAYLIPFFNSKAKCYEVQMIPGYKGLIDLARRSGQIESISARVVREKDLFEYEYGDDEKVRHKPWDGPEDQAGRITHAYAIARLKGGGIQREVMTRGQLDRIKESKKPENPVWETHFDEMARKTAVRRLCKYLPMSPELARGLDMDNKAYDGVSQETHRIIDVPYELEATVSEDATTPMAINAEEEAKTEAKTMTELRSAFVTGVGKRVKDGEQFGAVYKAIGLDGPPDLMKFNAQQLTALLVNLRGNG